MSIVSVTLQKRLRTIAATAWLATIVLAAAGIDWTVGPLWALLLIYAMVALLTFLPYGLYLPIVPKLQVGPAFQIAFLTILVAIPVILFSYWRLVGAKTGGWDFFIVPFLQLGCLALVPIAMKLASFVAQRISGHGT